MRKFAAAVFFGGALAIAGCTAEQTEEGELPDVDVSVDSGNLPRYDVDPAQVDINRDTTKVITPDVDVRPPESNTRQ